MHTAGQTYSRVNQRGRWIVSTLALVLLLFGCTTSKKTRQVAPPPVVPSSTTSVTATYTLEDIQPASMRDATHVVITVSGPVQPLVQRFSQPDRLAIDLPETQLAPQWSQHSVSVSDGRLQTIQVTQSQPDRVQITLALQAIRDYHIVVQSAPHRVTVELLGAVTTAHTRALEIRIRWAAATGPGPRVMRQRS